MNFHLKAVSKPIELIRFEVGKNYTHKYIGDSNLFTTYKVLSRTKCFLKIQEQLKTKNKPICLQKPVIVLRVKIFNYQGVENCYPVGNFSKCPILSADKKNNELDRKKEVIKEIEKMNNTYKKQINYFGGLKNEN